MGAIFVRVYTTRLFCNNRDKTETPENINVNFSSSEKDFVLLQTAEVNLFNKSNCAEVRAKILFDSGSERSYISRRAQNILNFTKLKINTFGSANSKVTTV